MTAALLFAAGILVTLLILFLAALMDAEEQFDAELRRMDERLKEEQK